MRPAILLILIAAACSRSGSDDTSAGSSETGCSGEGCVCEVDDDCDDGLVCASRTCTPSAGGEVSSSGGESSSTGSEAGDSEADTSTGGDDTSSGGSSGSTSSSTSTATTDESSSGTTEPAACGDGEVNAKGEECDDGNLADGDGCDAMCKLEPWQHEGVAHDVPVADLYGWTQCWSDDYSGTNEKVVVSLAASCDKAQLLFACTPIGSDTLTLAAHAAREDVLFPVDYSQGERHTANGVAWYWSPVDNYVGYGPAGNMTPCGADGEDDQLCWYVSGGNPDDTFSFGGRCGAKLGFTDDEAPMWQRLVFERD